MTKLTEQRIDEAIGMVHHLFPKGHAFSKRYVLEVLIDCLELTKERAVASRGGTA